MLAVTFEGLNYTYGPVRIAPLSRRFRRRSTSPRGKPLRKCVRRLVQTAHSPDRDLARDNGPGQPPKVVMTGFKDSYGAELSNLDTSTAADMTGAPTVCERD